LSGKKEDGVSGDEEDDEPMSVRYDKWKSTCTVWIRGVQVKLWDPLRTRAIPERLRGAFTTMHYKTYVYLYFYL